MLSIEVGCLAVILGDFDECGSVVTVVSYLGKCRNFKQEDSHWYISKPVTFCRYSCGYLVEERRFNHCPESHLMRIDGNQELFEKEKEKERV